MSTIEETERFRDHIWRTEGYESEHIGAVRVRVKCDDDSTFDGVVQVFKLPNHPYAKIAYAWRASDGGDVIALSIPPFDTLEAAVRASRW